MTNSLSLNANLTMKEKFNVFLVQMVTEMVLLRLISNIFSSLVDPVAVQVGEKHLSFVDWKVRHFLYLLVSPHSCNLCVCSRMRRST